VSFAHSFFEALLQLTAVMQSRNKSAIPPLMMPPTALWLARA
jgi:hypothetical protein